ncbi:hypothetical protein CVT24_009682 [Panaeolus cyanescens]|uniref:F-box domain-containing protein n=1 Tax=Panaeolus cyanescens TaxID=181874 RepID=A0A409Y9U2_9AGAR|nr:hypothetical protein CVT24_009682 [Panaeolus cyanescens]
MSNMEPPPAPKVSLDVLHRIIDNFDPYYVCGYQALSQCALVAKALRPYCQRKLFAFMDITYDICRVDDWLRLHTPIDTLESKRFLRIITESPVLATYIRTLKIRLEPRSMRVPRKPKCNLKTVSSLITSLDTFALCCPQELGWMNLDGHIQNSIVSVFERNDLKELDFEMRDIPLKLFALSPNLRTISAPSLTNEVKNDHHAPPRSIPLASLEVWSMHRFSRGLGGVETYFTDPKCPISLSHLNKLWLNNLLYDHKVVSSILSLCASSVTELELGFRLPTPGFDMPYSEAVSPNLSDFAKLRSFRIVGHIETEWETEFGEITQTTFSQIPWITGIVKTLPVLEPRLKLTLQIQCHNLSLEAVDEIAPSLGHLVDIIDVREAKFKSPRLNFALLEKNPPPAVAESQPNLRQEVQTKLEENEHLKKLGRYVTFGPD